MSGFIPPFPPRHAKALSVVEMVARGAENFLSIFDESAFEHQTMSIQVLTRQVFICNFPDVIRHVFVTNQDNYMRKGAQIRASLTPLLGDASFVGDGEGWSERRRIVAPALHANYTAMFLPAMLGAVSDLAARWQAALQASRQPLQVDVVGEMMRLSADVAARAFFGERLAAAHVTPLVEAVADYRGQADRRDIKSLLGLPDWLKGRTGGALAKSAARAHGVMDQILAGHAAAPDRRSLAFALQHRSQGALDPVALRHEMLGLFLAAHETTASCLSWALYLVSQVPQVEQRLHEELDRVLGGQPPQVAELAALAYARAVIEETLRLYPPVPMLVREAAAPDVIRERKIAAGALVIAVPWLLHRHRLLWREPDTFLPERFLPGSADAPKKFAYIPFSVGPRSCPGSSFGLTEAVACLATLAQAFTLRLVPGTRVEPVGSSTLLPGSTLPMIVTPRPAAQRGGAVAAVRA